MGLLLSWSSHTWFFLEVTIIRGGQGQAVFVTEPLMTASILASVVASTRCKEIEGVHVASFQKLRSNGTYADKPVKCCTRSSSRPSTMTRRGGGGGEANLVMGYVAFLYV